MIAEDQLAAEAQDWMESRIVVKVKVTSFLAVCWYKPPQYLSNYPRKQSVIVQDFFSSSLDGVLEAIR